MEKNRTEDQLLSEIYQKLCNCQDLAESAGELTLMYEFEELRHEVDEIRFSK